MKLITLKTFSSDISAHLLKTRLESEGVECFILDENIVRLNSFYDLAVGGIRLQVREEDFQRAKALIEEWEGLPYLDEENRELRCPKCQSTSVYAGFKSFNTAAGWLTLVISFLLVIYPFFTKTVFRCKECGTTIDTKD
jgi:DNA-directed RNA polymerase subunit RPC12/RpoP